MTDEIDGPQAEIVMYQADGRNVPVAMTYADETFWMPQRNIAQLFDVNVPAISKHLANIYQEGELIETSTISKKEIVRNEGGRTVRREITFYNLDAIIAEIMFGLLLMSGKDRAGFTAGFTKYREPIRLFVF
jgi:hypothetical protein